MVKPAEMTVEIAYADSSAQTVIIVSVAENTTILEAITQSTILKQFPEIDLARNAIGIFSKIVPLSTRLQAGDRIEIYQPLLIDPKAARKRRAKQQKDSAPT
jgi:putative ubiquitin-RnfH superfamily antitoxin RatB of RatAB toxin-antitoxin module